MHLKIEPLIDESCLWIKFHLLTRTRGHIAYISTMAFYLVFFFLQTYPSINLKTWQFELYTWIEFDRASVTVNHICRKNDGRDSCAHLAMVAVIDERYAFRFDGHLYKSIAPNERCACAVPYLMYSQ